MIRRFIRHIPLLVLVALAIGSAACDVAFQDLSASATDTWQKQYTLAAGGRFELSNVNGTIEVTPSADATAVEVVAERKARASSEQAARDILKTTVIAEQVSPDTIKLDVPREGGGFGMGRRQISVNFKVRVPKGAVVSVSTLNGGVRVAGVLGAVKVRTTNGEITGEGLGGAVDGGTTNGAIKVQVTAVQPEGIRLDTTNGPIDLRIPADAKANVSARWTNGSFETSGVRAEGEKERRRYDGKLNGGGPRIELSTTNGGIRISS
jgi:DUF4097 and DUF4098 domain-containing protein YvlB